MFKIYMVVDAQIQTLLSKTQAARQPVLQKESNLNILNYYYI